MTIDESPSWRDRLGRLAGELRVELERAGRTFEQVLGSDQRDARRYLIAGYRGYGTAVRVLVHGRVIESRNIDAPSATDSMWRNLFNTYKRIDADPLGGARVHVRIGGVERELVADDEGFFREWVDLPLPLPDDAHWHDAELVLRTPSGAEHPEVRGSASVRVPAAGATFGVISDLDDTVIQSRITSFLQAVRTVMLGNARTRLPFPGVAAFYQALERGGDGARANPIFYVSSSPWNIYDIIADFMDIQRIPMGPIHLRDWDIGLNALSSHRLKTHKEPIIREILDLYPALPFILIGDDSQKDPEIYRAILDRYPGRILAIYIRNVRVDPERSASVQALAKEVLAAGSTLVLADDSFAAASHAVEQGWITKDSLAAVHEEKRADEGVSGEKADVPGVPEEKKAPTVVVE
ncbi:MAG: phosphatase domain-containing protein [Gemmatimonadaceae bacterium]